MYRKQKNKKGVFDALGAVFAGIVFFLAAVYGLIVLLFSSAPCSYDKNEAIKLMENFILEKNLNVSKIQYVGAGEYNCEQKFIYRGTFGNYEISIIDDFVKGAKVTGDIDALSDEDT